MMADARQEKGLGALSPLPDRIDGALKEVAIGERRNRFGDMTGRGAEFLSPFRLEPDIQLAEIVKGGEHAKALHIRVVEIATRQAPQPPVPKREGQEAFGDCRDVGAVVEQGVPFPLSIRRVPQLPPERGRYTAHLVPY
jgi:hypothetical protein